MKTKNPPPGAFSLSDAGRFTWERRDCAVRAMTVATGRTYADCHAALKAAGRVDGKGARWDTLEKALGRPFVSYIGLQRRWRGDQELRPTAAALLRSLPKGRHIVFVTGHFFAVVDGVQVDIHPSLYRPRSRVWGYWTLA